MKRLPIFFLAFLPLLTGIVIAQEKNNNIPHNSFQIDSPLIREGIENGFIIINSESTETIVESPQKKMTIDSVRSFQIDADPVVTMTGVHGANRLASNSLLESLVFSFRAASDLIGSIKEKPRKEKKIELVEWDDSGTENAEEWVVVEHDRREVQQLMWDYVGIVRSTYRLKRSERRLKLIAEEIEAYYRKTKVTVPLLELRNIALTALLIVRSALKRKESRGLHYMADYPLPNPRLAKVDTVLQKKI